MYSRFSRHVCMRAGAVTTAVMAAGNARVRTAARLSSAPTPPGAGLYARSRRALGRSCWLHDSSTWKEGCMYTDFPLQAQIPDDHAGSDCIGVPYELVRALGSR